MEWFFRRFFNKQRKRLVRAIENREAALRNRNKYIAYLLTKNHMLNKEIKDLRDLLFQYLGGPTKRAVDGACTCDPSVAQSYYVDGVEKCAECRRPRR